MVESVGEGVTKFQVGDHVILLFIPQCNECTFCLNPNSNLCDKLRVTQNQGILPEGSSRFRCKGQDVFHFMGTSTFTDYTVVADISLCKVDVKAPLDKICLLGCGIATGYGAALNTARVQPGSTCAIWGLGAIGLACAMGCKKAGASRIIGVDLNSEKFALAEKFGCTECVNPQDYPGRTIVQVLTESLTNGGLDYTFECVGNVNTMRAALESTHRGWGTSVIIGMAPPGAEIATTPLNLVLGRTWKGSAFGGWKSVESVPRLVESYMRKEVMLDEFITHTLSLLEVNEAFQLMHEGKSIRTTLIL